MSEHDFFRVVLPWPDWKISPNGTKDRHTRARLTKEHRYLAKCEARNAIGYRNWIDEQDTVFSVWLFRQPDKRKRDTGNMRGAMKAYQDGIADALRIDDHAIKDEYLHLDGIIEGGEVELRLYEDVLSFIDDIKTLLFDKHK